MIQIPPNARIFTIPELLSFECDLDHFIEICKRLGFDPFSGELFVFKSEEQTQIGILFYDGQGFHWSIKRFSEIKLEWWPSYEKVVRISARDLQIMLWGGNPEEVKLPPMWRPL